MQSSHGQPRYESDIQQFFLWYRDNSEPGICGYTRELNCTFVPFSKLQILFQDYERITRLLQSVFGADRQPAVNAEKLSGGYERVFAILLLIGRGEYIGLFVQSGVDDARLPLTAPLEEVSIPARDADFFTTFYRCQWQFCPHYFSKSYNRTQLGNETILPITSIQELRGSANVDVVQIVIHPEYNKLNQEDAHPDQNNVYTLKRYCVAEAETYFLSELDAFRAVQLGSSGESNLIGFFGTFEQHGTYNVLLESADQGTLLDYFQKAPPVRPEDIQCFWRNLLSLFKTLDIIHKTKPGDAYGPQVLQGWHGHINPVSILVKSRSQGSKFDVEFKLADLGIDHFMVTMAAQTGRAPIQRASRAYSAPEISSREDSSFLGEVQPEADIWSLGCILSDAVTWVVRGLDGLEEYRMRRKVQLEQLGAVTDEYSFHNGRDRLTCVDEWHSELVSFKRPTDLISEPVWAQMIRDMLGDLDERPTSKQLMAKSRRVLAGASNEPSAQAIARPTRSRTTASATGSTTSSQMQHEPHGPMKPPESLFNLSHSRTVPNRRPVPTSQTRDESFRYTINQPQQSFFVETDDDYCQSLLASPLSYTKSGSSRGIPASTAPTSPGSPQIQSVSVRTSESLVPRDILSGMQNVKLSSQTQSPGVNRQLSTYSGITSSSAGPETSEVLQQQSPQLREYSRPSSNLVRVESDTLPQEDRRSISIASEGFRPVESNPRPPEYTPLITSTTNLVPAPLNTQNSTEPKPNPKAAPLLTVSRLHAWRQDMREKSSSITIDTQERIHLLPADKREHVFLIDDASSMQSQWLDLTFLFSDFSYFIKNLPSDGISMWFTLSTERKKSKATTDFLKMLEKRGKLMETAGPSTSNMESRLKAVLAEYTTALENERAPPGRTKHSPFVKKPPPVRPLSLHVYTDGIWQPKCEVENPIRELDRKLDELKLHKSQVAISFVLFGHDEAAMARLRRIEAMFKFVDVEPFKSGNVWKMLNGAIDARYKEPQFLPVPPVSTPPPTQAPPPVPSPISVTAAPVTPQVVQRQQSLHSRTSIPIMSELVGSEVPLPPLMAMPLQNELGIHNMNMTASASVSRHTSYR